MKTIVVVGAGSGLGNGVAEKFASEGFRVILMARNEKHLKEYKDSFKANGIDVITQVADASDFEGFKQSFDQLLKTYGTPDVLFYNVGITVADDTTEITPEVLVERYKTDVAGAYNCIKLIDTPAFSEKKGTILITGGGLALNPYAGYLPLSMDKAALRAMVQALAPVLEEKDIFLATVQVTGVIGSDEHFAPSAIAEAFYKLYKDREANEIIY